MLQITGIVVSLAFLLFQTAVCTAASIRDLADNPKVTNPDAVSRAYSQPGHAKTADASRRGRFILRLRDDSVGTARETLDGKASRVAAQQSAALDRLTAITDAEIRVRFQYQNSLAVSVTAAQFAELLDSDDVVSVEEDGLNHITTAQGIPLIHADTVRSSFTGQGISIAITDTGIDYTHSMLGGGGFPNSKVIGGYDTGEDDTDPMDLNGHGTACAGIAAGRLSGSSDYVGGVAPDARLYALKITYSPSGGYAYDSDIIEAWEWCVTHQNDDPAYPIMIVSTSFGGGKFAGSCDAGYTALATAADSLAAAGIALFVSSGNEGYCDSVARPACLSGSIAVGAVYDAFVGTYAFCVDEDACLPSDGLGSCSAGYKRVTQTTSAGRVTVYSNSGAMLDLFAPAHNATTLDTGGGYTSAFGGTSAAAPYAAGAAALLQQATKAHTGAYLTVSELKQKLQATGSYVTDAKAGLSRALIDLQEAVGSVIGSLPVVSTGGVPSVSGNWAIVNGSVASDGWTRISSKGVCVNTAGAPTLADSCTVSGSGVGDFSSLIQGLSTSTTYYARAFGINREGAQYGAEVAFATTETPTPVPTPAPPPSPAPSPSPPPPAPPSYSALFFFHNELSGQVVYWQVDASGRLASLDQGTGWDYVSRSLFMGSDWRLSGSLELGGAHTLFWQNAASGEVRFWKTASNGLLQDETEGSGWGRVSADFQVPEGWLGAGFETIGGEPSILWQHQIQGMVCYWRIATDGRLKNSTRNEGWGLVSDELRVNSDWRLVEILEIGGQNTLIWQNQASGKVVYWRLGEDAVLKNRTRGDGWDYVADSLVVNSNWRLAGAASVGNVQTLFWQNQESGKVAYWRLSDAARLVNETRGEGWDFVADELIVPDGWHLAGVAALGTGNSLIWQNQSSGALVYWHLTDDARLKDRARNSGWGFVSDELRLAPAWRLGVIARK